MLRSESLPPVPAEIVRVTRAAFPKGHPNLAAADALGAVFTDDASHPGQPALADFHLDWEGQRATCPAGQTSSSWRQRPDLAGRDLIWVKFSSKDCGPCPSRPACCRAQGRSPRRTLCLRPRAQSEALQAARQRESTAAFGETSALRAGIEGTLARGIRRCRLRRTRYRGQPKVHLDHSLTATGRHFLRPGEWSADMPHRKPPRSPLVRLLVASSAA